MAGFFVVSPVGALAEAGAVETTPNYNLERIFYSSTGFEKQAIMDIYAHSDKIDILAPQAYAVGADLVLRGSLSENLKKAVKEKNVKVMPLVVNAKFNQITIHKFLLDSAAQNKMIQGLVDLGKQNSYIGWQFDFENINHQDRDLYSAFVEKAAAELHKNNLILSVAAVSRSRDYEDTPAYKNWGGAFDYARLSKAVDFISLMTYDDDKSFGPTSSVLFVKWVLAYVKDKIPQEKLSMGIPFYYWGWKQNPLKRVSSGSYGKVKLTMENFECRQGFDESLGVSWLTYSTGKNAYKIWYEDQKSFQIKLDIVKNNNLRGFSAWVLGQEDPEVWNVLSPNANFELVKN